jgi:hypothetical protein
MPPPAAAGADQALKLRAVDGDDLMVMAAILQDAVTCLTEMAYVTEEQRFYAAFLRFRREMGNGDTLLQCQCALTVDGVDAVRYRGIDPRFGRVRLELLTIDGEDEPGGASQITLIFAGGAAIQLTTQRINVRLQDFGECQPARSLPEHMIVAQSDA